MFPQGPFDLMGNATNTLVVSVRPETLTPLSAIATLVDVERKVLLRTWMLTVLAQVPEATKVIGVIVFGSYIPVVSQMYLLVKCCYPLQLSSQTFEVVVPLGTTVSKRISYKNPHGETRCLHITTDRPDMLLLRTKVCL